MEKGILNGGFHLSSLEVLSIGDFNLMERGILSDTFHQSSLETLSLHNCNLMEEGIPSDIWNLSSLDTEISIGASDFQGKGMSVVIPRSSRILEGIRNESTGSDEIMFAEMQNIESLPSTIFVTVAGPVVVYHPPRKTELSEQRLNLGNLRSGSCMRHRIGNKMGSTLVVTP
ncbi:hypothetical protein CK203_052891 [Vitis vinifera]|uniref:Uncharacterized protein n=1 Tax=Vitis vinifera TaxID=29760 RepID=A0A438H7J2_VITVI|nr:hypothetical protein CK203_052891 [Vitis vinifera]